MRSSSPGVRGSLLAGLTAAAALAIAACSGGAAATTAPTPRPSATSGGSGAAVEVKLVKDATLGDFLAGSNGMTLYVFTKDTPGKSVCNDKCATAWPPLVLKAGENVKAGDGVSGTFGTVTRDDGSTQVTYNGAPIYFYAKDAKAGDTTGQGVGGVWFVVPVSGPMPTTVPATPAPSTAGGGGGSAEEKALIIDFAFNPVSIKVKAGGTVTWTNNGEAPHTVTADDGSFKSESLASKGTFTHTFDKAGTFAFHCAIHPNMKGTVVVE